MGLEDLSASRRAKYEALVPEIRRKSREASNARGMFYSGDSADAETRAQAQLLAELASEDSRSDLTQSEGDKNRAANAESDRRAAAAAKRGQMLGIVGTGIGAAGTFAGLKYMNPKGGANTFYDPKSGNLFSITDGKATPIQLPGQTVGGGAFSAPTGSPWDPNSFGDGPLPGLGGRSQTGAPGVNLDPNYSSPTFGQPTPRGMSVGAPGTQAPASMWSRAGSSVGGLKGLGAAGAGGFAGNRLAHLVNGGGRNTDIGSAMGGLAGLGAYSKFGGGNPWLAGLSGLGGAFGGGLLGSLF